MTHIGAYKHFKKRDNILGIPVVMLSALVGTVAFANVNLSTQMRDIIDVCIGITSLIVAMLSGVRGFLGWERRAANHEKAFHGYAKICRKIEKELILQKANAGNGIPGDKFINELADMLEVLGSDCPTIPDKVLKNLGVSYDNSSTEHVEIIDSIEEIRDNSVQTSASLVNNGSVSQKEIEALKNRASALNKLKISTNFFNNFGRKSAKKDTPSEKYLFPKLSNELIDNEMKEKMFETPSPIHTEEVESEFRQFKLDPPNDSGKNVVPDVKKIKSPSHTYANIDADHAFNVWTVCDNV